MVIKFVDTLRKAASDRKASGVEVLPGPAPVEPNTHSWASLLLKVTSVKR